MKNKVLSLGIILLIATALFLTGCGGKAASSGTGRIEGILVQKPESIAMQGTVKLMAEKYMKATPQTDMTLTPDEYREADLQGSRFTLDDIQPGRYFLQISVTLAPCFLGAPGQVFNGMQISYHENWSAVGMSLRDGTSLITGKTDIYQISAGMSLEITLALPRCY